MTAGTGYVFTGSNGRRNFDKNLEVLCSSINSLQMSVAALEERVQGMQRIIMEMRTSITTLQDALHVMDKMLVARVSTITITERVLWALATAVIGVIASMA